MKALDKMKTLSQTMTVTVKNGTAKAERYKHVVAVGIGHVTPNLVLVQRAPNCAEMVVDINHLHYDRVTIRKPKPKDEP